MFPLAVWSSSLLHGCHMSPLPNIMARHFIRMIQLTDMMASTVDQRFVCLSRQPDFPWFSMINVLTCQLCLIPPKITQVSLISIMVHLMLYAAGGIPWESSFHVQLRTPSLALQWKTRFIYNPKPFFRVIDNPSIHHAHAADLLRDRSPEHTLLCYWTISGCHSHVGLCYCYWSNHGFSDKIPGYTIRETSVSGSHTLLVLSNRILARARFRASVAPDAYQGHLDATKYGALCPQQQLSAPDTGIPEITQIVNTTPELHDAPGVESEDCKSFFVSAKKTTSFEYSPGLTINIIKPNAKGHSSHGLPVLVVSFCHFGCTPCLRELLWVVDPRGYATDRKGIAFSQLAYSRYL